MSIVMVNGGAMGTILGCQSAPGQYLAWYDPDALGGLGACGWTDHIEDAKRFPDFISAHDEYRRVSTRYPLRGDGRPNRPLTAYSIMFRSTEETANA